MKRYLLLLLLATGVHAQSSNEFAALVERVQKSPGAVTVDEVSKLLQLSKDLNRPFTAAIAVKAYFSQNLNAPPALLKAAAENAALAGDFRTAASRYKQYLRTNPDSEVAAQLYQLQLDFLGATDDAYRFMDEFGDNLRQSVAAKKYDAWFLATARERKQPVAFARRLALVLADQMPLDVERLHFWEHIDALANDIAVPVPELYDTLPHVKRVAGLIRNAPRLQARYNFLAANLAFRISSTDIAPLNAAARAYLDAAPTGDTLRDITTVFANSRYDGALVNKILAARSDLFLYAFDKFPDTERAAYLAHPNLMASIATPAQWTELTQKYPAVFAKSPGTMRLQLLTATNEVFQESWRLSFGEVADTFRSLPAEVQGKLLTTPLPVFFPAIAQKLKVVPGPLAVAVSNAVAATKAKDTAAYLTAARAAYAQVRDYDVKKTPFGSAVLAYLLQPRADAFEFQCEILADQLNRYDPQSANRPLREVVAALLPNRARYKQVNDVFAKAMLDQLAKKQFSPELFTWFRQSRRSESGLDQTLHPEVLAKMIEQKTLQGTDYRIESRSATCTYQWLIRNEFSPLTKNFSVISDFDAMFAEETKRTRVVDPAFWAYSTDEKRLGANAAAEVLGDYAKYPFGYEGEKNVYTRAQFFELHARAALADAPVRAAWLAKLETTTRVDGYANGAVSLAGADVSTDAGRKAFFDKVNKFLTAAAGWPVRVPPPSFAALTRLNPAKLTPDEVNVLVRVFRSAVPAQWPANNNHETLCLQLLEGLLAQKQSGELFPLLPHFWKIAKDTGNTGFARLLTPANLEADLAAADASIGLDMLGGALPEDSRNSLLAIRSKSLSNIGTIVPVERSDRRYPLFVAQAAYLSGKLDNAWQQYGGSRELVAAVYRELDPAFTIWIVEKNTELGNFDEADALARTLIQWVDAAPQNFDPEIRARLFVAFASIAFARQEYPRARAQFEQIATAQEFGGTQAKREAELKMAEVDRLTKHYDKATDLLEKLARRKDAYVQAQANYQLALVKFDQEQYPESRQALEQVFAIEPTHPNARILEGKLYLKLKKLVEATEVRVGLAANQRTIVPGKPLKIQLEDRNLAVAGKAANIEIRVWADSGDEEIFNLLPFGDSKTKFEGTVPTALGAPKQGDRLLQITGADSVHYDYSDKFKQLRKITAGKPATIAVISDGELYISSGKILSKAEQEQRALEALIRSRMTTEESTAQRVALSTVRADNEVKPGAPINLRVVDLDASKTAGKNTVTVRAATTSGDRIDAFTLTETAQYTGVFEGRLPTASAGATAYASDSEEGREPSFAIATGDLPAWVGLADNKRPKVFNVDLNNNVPLGKLTILADVPGRKLKSFLVQTSLNGKEFTSVGAWPTAVPAWDGAPRWEAAAFNAKSQLTTLDQLRDYLDVGYLTAGAKKVVGEKLVLPGDGWNVARFSGLVQLPARQVRTFRVDHKNQLKNLRYILTVDGQPDKDPYEVTRSLSRGTHRVDLYVFVQKGATMEYELLADGVPAVFDGKASGFQPATVTNGTEVAFAPGTRARVVRLWLLDFETDAPAIRKLILTDPDGNKVLPVAQDVAGTRKNQVLEIVPGDRITVTYEDPRCVTKERQVLEDSLTATYHNATLSACFIDSTVDASGNRTPQYIPMRRFKPGDAVNVFINDADGDVSDAQDRVKFWAQVGEGKRVALEALETEAHSGVFLGKVFPISGAPQRPAELTVGKDDDVQVGYMDVENTDPGIAWERTFVVEQTVETTPVLTVYDMVSRALTEQELKILARGAEAKHVEEFVPVTRTITAVWSNKSPAVLVGCPMLVDLVYPTIAQSFQSEATIMLQAGKPGEFDPNLPGTITVKRSIGDAVTVTPPAGYREVQVRGNPKALDPLEDGRFTFVVPVKLGASSAKDDDLIEVSMRMPSVDRHGDTQWIERKVKVPGLGVRPGDEIRISFQGIVQHVPIKADALFDVTERRYESALTALHVGESMYFRVIDPLGDVSDEKDTVEVKLNGGAVVKLSETFSHSGIFKGKADVVFAGDTSRTNAIDAVRVNYGDTIRCVYRAGEVERNVEVFKGANGDVLPFTKRFKDPEIAVQTQFTIAEAYFEMAKKHRELGQEDLSRKEIAQGKKLLEEVIRDYPNTEARAQADYLLADLAFEGATDATDDETKKRRFMEAVVRFSDIVATYPDSAYAPKAQFKKALVFEKTGQMDQACEEYVKLSYRYPDNELVAETIARLGQYFLTKGKEYQDKALAAADAVAKEKENLQAREMFKTAAQVFGRLAKRFPDHKLSGKTTVLSAQCWMRAEELEKAVDVFKVVIDEKKAEPDLIAQSMFWCGECYMKMKQPDLVNAYRMYKRLTWDYPESKWAKSARGRLTEDALAKIEQSDSASNQ